LISAEDVSHLELMVVVLEVVELPSVLSSIENAELDFGGCAGG
jgi:hypothetical protein